MSLFSQTDAAAARMGLDVFLRENWRLVVPLALAFVGIYLLLPRVRRAHPIIGGALAGLGLGIAGVFWIRPEALPIENALFYTFSGFAIVGAAMMLCQTNPVHAALSFALVVLSTCGLFLILAAPFLMAATIVVYAGAIVVTFLFVIMLAQQAGVSNADQRSREPFFASLAGFILLGTLIAVLGRSFDTRSLDGTLEKLERLAAAKSRAEVVDLLGEPPATLEAEHASPLVREIHKRFLERSAKTKRAIDAGAGVEIEHLINNLESAWVGLGDPKNVELAADLGKKLLDRGQQLRQHGEVLQPTKGPPSLLEPATKMPANNVAALGKVLFVDYLIPVEMAGMLLLVATIGAIAIAGRRSEELR